LSRNPLYLSLSLLSIVIGVAADAPWVAAMVAPAIVVMRYRVIGREERYLEAKFGEDYACYKASVRRRI
jgi:protein-S-isoprenylcysteine O-methyltransferase Ste14